MSNRTYTCLDVSRLTGIPAQRIRVNMASGLWDLGTYIPSKNGKKAYYNITAEKVYKQFGICIDGYEPIAPKQNEAETIDKLIKAIEDLLLVVKTEREERRVQA